MKVYELEEEESGYLLTLKKKNLGENLKTVWWCFPENDSHMLAKSDVENCDISHNVPGNPS